MPIRHQRHEKVAKKAGQFLLLERDKHGGILRRATEALGLTYDAKGYGRVRPGPPILIRGTDRDVPTLVVVDDVALLAHVLGDQLDRTGCDHQDPKGPDEHPRVAHQQTGEFHVLPLC